MLQMSSMMNEMGGGGLGGFPAPGLTGMTPPAATGPIDQSSPNTAAPGAAGALPPFNPALMQQLMGASGGGLFGAGVPTTPADSRPPEERFQTQLQVCAYHISDRTMSTNFRIAITGNGFLQRNSEYSSFACYWRECTCSYRVFT
jgi:ubiquilin